MDTAESIIAEAARLLTMSGVIPAWAVVLGVIGLAVLLVLSPTIGRVVWAALKNIKREPPTEVDEGGKVIDLGAREGGGPPGGGPTGGEG